MNQSPRVITQKYHQHLYKVAVLFEKGTWLEKPEADILDIVERYFIKKRNVTVLDLGSGVGRNAIPIAQKISPNAGKVVCVDYLDIAIKKLYDYARKYRVERAIEGYVEDVERFEIAPELYDFILSHGVLNHVSSRESLLRVLANIMKGTKPNGVNYLALITDLVKSDTETGKRLPPDVEVPLGFKEGCNMLNGLYRHWCVFTLKKDPFTEQYKEEGRTVLWKANFLVFIAQKRGPEHPTQ